MSAMSTQGAPRVADAPVSTGRIVLWTLLFQFAWFRVNLVDLFGDGVLPDTDDFQRLAQVRAWMSGQGWFDVVNHRMDPPLGADMHWSRLVDVPIAALIALFDLFLDTQTAERLAMAVWPTALLVATVLVVLALCRRIDARSNPLLALLFTVTCVTALSEFAPGRIDHHNVQILFFCLMLYGMALPVEGPGRAIAGAAAAASISVGLDSILVIAFLLGWIGLQWADGQDRDGRGLRRAAAGILGAALPLYVANFPPSQWLAGRCDANSAFYMLALALVAGSYLALSVLSHRFDTVSRKGTIARFAAAVATGAAALLALAAVFPVCLRGPFAQMDPELATRWLPKISEARNLFQYLAETPAGIPHMVGYSLLLAAIAVTVVWRRGLRRPEHWVLLAALLISLAASMLQVRALRIGVFASIPFLVVFVGMAAQWLSARSASRPVAGALQAALVLFLLPPVWLLSGVVLFPKPGQPPAVVGAAVADVDGESWRSARPAGFCNRQSDYATLAGLPAGVTMSDNNSGAAIPVFTAHDSIGGPYHRNAAAILDMLDFFGSDLAKAEAIARRRGFAYVAWCEPVEPVDPEGRHAGALAVHILAGTHPGWLERVGAPGERLHVFRVKGL